MGVGPSAYRRQFEKGVAALQVEDIDGAVRHFTEALSAVQSAVPELHQPLDIAAARKQRILATAQSGGGVQGIAIERPMSGSPQPGASHLGNTNPLLGPWQLSPAASRVPSRQQPGGPMPPPLAVVPPTPTTASTRGGKSNREAARDRRSSWAHGLSGTGSNGSSFAQANCDDLIMESMSQHSSAGGGRTTSDRGDEGNSGATAFGTSNDVAGHNASGYEQLFEFVSRDELPVVCLAVRLRVDIGIALMDHYLGSSIQREQDSYLMDLAGKQFAIVEPVLVRLRAQMFGTAPTLQSAAVDEAFATCHVRLAEIRIHQYKALVRSISSASAPTAANATCVVDHDGGAQSSLDDHPVPVDSVVLDYLWNDAMSHVDALKRFASERYSLIDERLVPIFHLDAELLALRHDWRKAIMTMQRCVGYCVSRFGLNDMRTLAHREELHLMKAELRASMKRSVAAQPGGPRGANTQTGGASAAVGSPTVDHDDTLDDDDFFTSNGDIITFIPAPPDNRKAPDSA